MVHTPAMKVFRRVTTLEGAGLDGERERRGKEGGERRGGEDRQANQELLYY